MAFAATIFSLVAFGQSAFAATTIISTDTTVANVTVNAGDLYQINPGITLTVTDTFNNFGTVDNDGTIHLKDTKLRGGFSTFNNDAGATLNNFNRILLSASDFEGEFAYRSLTNVGSIKNFGNIWLGFLNNTGTIVNDGEIRSGAASEGAQPGFLNDGTLENNGDLIARFRNLGFATNNGTINFGATDGINYEEATLINFGHIGGRSHEGLSGLGNTGLLKNYGSIDAQAFSNAGTTDNYGNITGIPHNVISNSHIFNNHLGAKVEVGQSSSFANSGTITNFGTFYNWESEFTNDIGGTFNNENTGSIRLVDGIATNKGTINNKGSMSHEAPVVEFNVFNNEGTLNNFGSIQNQALSNYVNKATGLINNNAGATINNAGTFKNECTGIINNNGSILGNPVIAVPCPCVNLSLSGATASGFESPNVPANAIDNSFSTRWSNQGVGSWITVDLGQQKTVCNVDIAWFRGNIRASHFIISLSTDNTSFTNVFSGDSSGTTTAPETYDFADTSARYVRITVNGNTQNDFASILEIDVKGRNDVDTTPPTVTAAPAGGLYTSAQSVTLTADEPATIYYTTNGNDPTTASATYGSPIPIASTTTLKYFGKDAAGNSGSIAAQVYTIDTVPPTVTATPLGGTYSSAQLVSLSVNEPATIYYTTDGSTPTTSSTVYSSPISVPDDLALKYFAKDTAGNSGAVVTQNYVIEPSTPSFPVTHMSDTTSSFGLSTHSGRQIQSEFVSATSQLIGDKIDQITLKLRKAGTPTGTAQIGVFNTDLSVKKLFGTLDAATLTAAYTDYTFSLGGGDLYTIAAGDRIGIKFTGGNSANSVAVMIDSNAADPFDGTNSYRQAYTTLWQSFTAEDLYMILVQTHAPADDPTFPVTHMADTTTTTGLSTHAGRQAHVEFVSASSQLLGDKIDSMTVRLKKSGTPTGTVEIGVFNSDLSVKKLFGTLNPSTLTNGYADYTFSLGESDLYTIAADDRIGIKYAGGSSSNFVAIMTDTNAADPFDGNNSYRQHYTTTWQSFTSEDLYMVLLQTHG